jgi:hypothetical protein
LIGAPTFMERLNTEAPNSMIRNLEPLFLFGIHEFDGNQPFFMFTTNSFELVYAGMLEWERSINLDLYPLFGEIVTRQQATPTTAATSTGTSTASTSQPGPLTQNQTSGPRVAGFQDTVIANAETRVLRDVNGDIVLLWTFVDARTLIIATNEYTLGEIRDRITARTY